MNFLIGLGGFGLFCFWDLDLDLYRGKGLDVGLGVVGLGKGDVGGGTRDGVIEMDMNWLVYAHVHLGFLD